VPAPFFVEQVLSDLPFDFEVPISFFEKADAGAGKTRRIGGLISTESRDRQKELLLQRGLDFEPFAASGWYNDNHDKKTGGIIGYPDVVKSYDTGSKLPNGDLAKTAGTWAEGYLLDTPRATEVWELGKALQATGRNLGFSVEGTVHRRTGADKRTIAKATVRNVAVTGCPVNTDSKLEILAKSLEAIETAEPDAVEKALTMGDPAASPEGPKTGEGAGKVIAKEDLEADEIDEEKQKKSLTDAEAIAWVQGKMPTLDLATSCRIVELTKNLKRQGRL
jgi:hypothetical protein